MPASSRRRTILNLSRKLFLDRRTPPFAPVEGFSSSNLLSIISGLLVSVAIELAVFRLGEPVVVKAGGATFSLAPEFRDSQENGLVIFLAGGGGGSGPVVLGGTGLVFGGDSALRETMAWKVVRMRYC